MVAVAYADWERAKSVPPAEMVRFAKRFRFKAFLLDTWGKDGKTLLDFASPGRGGGVGREPEARRDHGGHRRVAPARAREATQGCGTGLLRGAHVGLRRRASATASSTPPASRSGRTRSGKCGSEIPLFSRRAPRVPTSWGRELAPLLSKSRQQGCQVVPQTIIKPTIAERLLPGIPGILLWWS